MCDLSSVSEIKSFADKFTSKELPVHLLVCFMSAMLSLMLCLVGYRNVMDGGKFSNFFCNYTALQSSLPNIVL